VDFAVTPYSVQYASSSGTFTTANKVDLTAGGLLKGRYFLIKLASNGATGAAFNGDLEATLDMSGSNGKIALVVGTTPATTIAGCPSGVQVADLLGYGTANCSETTAVAALSATKSALRKNDGCTDADNNSTDFTTPTLSAAVPPRNSTSPANDCHAPPLLTVESIAASEGDSGSMTFTFLVSLSKAAPDGGVTFDIATQDGSALAGEDYVAKNLMNQTIPAGQQTYNFDVTVNGDVAIEPDETFLVNISNVNGATIVNSQVQGIIRNDDSPVLTIDDVSAAEGNGTTMFRFTVISSLPAPAEGITFDIATSDGTAHGDNPASEYYDYLRRSLTGQTIPAGQTSYAFDVTVNGDTLVEPNEIFLVSITNARNAGIGDAQGQGTIENDDVANLLISQVYGGGNNSGATYRNDFIELFNRGTTTIDFAVTPYSVQYASATANFTTNKTDIIVGLLLPGHYFLIQEAGGTTNGVELPTPDISDGSINLSATAGKVALVLGTTSLTGSGCPFGVTVVDLLGYGATANCSETAPVVVSSTNANARSVIRTNSCIDTNNNSADYSQPTTAPVARNTASPSIICP
jgi:hypothetical protein